MTNILLDIAAAIMVFFTLVLIFTMISYLFVTHVPYVPSKTKELKKFLQEFKPAKDALFVDLGCGDGKVLFLAEQFGVQPLGYEVSPLPYLLALIDKLIKSSKARLLFRNFLKADFSKADLIYCYLLPELTNTAYQKARKECRPGTYFICNTFSLKSVQPLKTYFDQKQKPKLFIYKI